MLQSCCKSQVPECTSGLELHWADLLHLRATLSLRICLEATGLLDKLSPCHHSSGPTGAPQLEEEGIVPAYPDITCTPFHCLHTDTMNFIKPWCSGMLFYIIIGSSELIFLNDLGMGPSDKSAPKTWRMCHKGSAVTPLTSGMVGLPQQLYLLGCPWLSLLGLLICVSALLGVGAAHTKQCE